MSQDKISLVLEERTVEGKAVKYLRKEGIVPTVIHDHGKASVLGQVEYQLMFKTYQAAGKHHPINVTIGSKKYVAMIKTIDFEPRKNQISHVVFGAVKANEKIEAEIPVHPKYAEGQESTPAERASLIVINNLTAVNVEAIATSMPDVLYYDAEKLVAAGDHVTVADLEVPEGVELKVEADATLATVYEPSALAAANDAAGGDAEPGDEQAVDSDVTPEDASDDSDRDELNPGGRKQNESHEQGTDPEKH